MKVMKSNYKWYHYEIKGLKEKLVGLLEKKLIKKKIRNILCDITFYKIWHISAQQKVAAKIDYLIKKDLHVLTVM